MTQHLVLVVNDDEAILRAAREQLRDVDALELTLQMHVILNRSRKDGISFADAEKALGRPIDYDLPFDAHQIAAIAHGTPLVMSKPASVFSQSILEITKLL